MEKATFGAGCYWGVQAAFKKLKGIKKTTVGYMGGSLKNPTYEDVCSNKTGHIEVVEIIYEEKIISYGDLLNTFFEIHDPTQLNRQGPDIGVQYKSVIFYHTEEQKKTAEEIKNKIEKSGRYNKKIVTDIIKAMTFYPAEEYHQNFLEKQKQPGWGF